MIIRSTTINLFPGAALTGLLAIACAAAVHATGAPLYLVALGMGIAVRPLVPGCFQSGIDWAAKPVLRFGVALLGIRIGVEQIASLGVDIIALLMSAVLSTIGVGVATALTLRLPASRGLLTGSAVAICGASAALAVSAVLPRHREAEAQTLITVVGVTLLSTLAMITYPPIAVYLEFTAEQSGIFLGGTIHDVAQVVGAGYGVSPAVGDAAILAKLSRVAMLLPVCLLILLAVQRGPVRCDPGVGTDGSCPRQRPGLPFFLIGFAILATLNSAGLVSPALRPPAVQLSSACLLMAVVALGLKTSIADLKATDWRISALICWQTVWLALFVGAWLKWL